MVINNMSQMINIFQTTILLNILSKLDHKVHLYLNHTHVPFFVWCEKKSNRGKLDILYATISPCLDILNLDMTNNKCVYFS